MSPPIGGSLTSLFGAVILAASCAPLEPQPGPSLAGHRHLVPAWPAPDPLWDEGGGSDGRWLSFLEPAGSVGRFLSGPMQAQEGQVDVALDPGHSSWDVGAVGSGLREYQLTLEIATLVRSRLGELGYTVRLTREDARRVAPSVPSDPVEAIRVEQRARHRSAGAARAYASIHFNGHSNSALRGTETYFNSENFGESSWQLAAAIQRETVAALGAAGYTHFDRGVREDLAAGKPYGHFFSLRGPFPSALIEVLFLSNPEDAAMLHEEVARNAIAEGIASGIAAFLAREGR